MASTHTETHCGAGSEDNGREQTSCREVAANRSSREITCGDMLTSEDSGNSLSLSAGLAAMAAISFGDG